MKLRIAVLLAVGMSACATDGSAKKCELRALGELPVTMIGTRPIIQGTINGEPARFLADSGSFFSILTPERAAKHDLRSRPLPQGFVVRGIGGAERMRLVRVPELALDGLLGGQVLPNADFLVGVRRFSGEIDGIIGQNILGTSDAEYDLANGVIRIIEREGCKGRVLAYWARDEQVAELGFSRTTPARPLLITTAKLNGKKIRVMFDTGAAQSTVTLRAARRAGVRREDDGVAAAGALRGVGSRAIESSVASFDELDLGGEVIRNAKLHMGDIRISQVADLLLGADFFLSHRVYVDSAASKLYFTYNGGPVFDLSPVPGDDPRAESSVASEDASEDAGEYRRRGLAAAARRDFATALTALNRAVELDQQDAANYHQRAIVYAEMQRPEEASTDLDQALLRSPDSVPMLMLRGRVRLQLRDFPGAREDFARARRLEPDNSRLPLDVARALGGAGRARAAIAVLDAWLARYPDDVRVPDALSGRCRLRAVANAELDLALEDCNAALDAGLRTARTLGARALVYLRRQENDRSIEDFDAALDRQPRDADALYGRGLAKRAQGQVAEAQADLDAARSIDATVEARFARMRMTP